MDTIWHICEAIGVGAAAGLSPLVAIAVLVLAAAVSLGVKTDNTDVGFLTSIALVVIALIVVVQSFLLIGAPGGLKLRVAADRPRFAPIHLTLAVVLGAVAGGIVLDAEGDAAVIGALIGALSGGLVGYASMSLLGGVGARLDASAAREQGKKGETDAAADATASKRIIAFGVDVLTLAAVVLPLIIPLTGLILPILAIAVILGGRRREAKKHEGLRVLN
ncbi:MAG: hypothetical protein ACRDKI_11425 [Solirubrobacterales bacterium]